MTTNQEKSQTVVKSYAEGGISHKVPVERGTHIHYGRDSPIYQSTTKNTMVQHKMEGVSQSFKELAEKGRLLKRHNFQFGFDDQPMSDVKTEKLLGSTL